VANGSATRLRRPSSWRLPSSATVPGRRWRPRRTGRACPRRPGLDRMSIRPETSASGSSTSDEIICLVANGSAAVAARRMISRASRPSAFRPCIRRQILRRRLRISPANSDQRSEKAGLALVVNCPPLPESAFVDWEMWEKIVLNLLSNAFMFTLEG
jgi:hypothetical protein